MTGRTPPKPQGPRILQDAAVRLCATTNHVAKDTAMNSISRLKRLGALALLASASAATTLGLAATAHADAPVNLKVDDTIREELLETGASLHGVPASEYVGLWPGLTYYAYDPDSMTYWAGAHLVPSATSQRAQVSVQDDGSYTLFKKIKGGLWTAFSDGARRDAGCPQDVPAPILAMWQWDPQKCRP